MLRPSGILVMAAALAFFLPLQGGFAANDSDSEAPKVLGFEFYPQEIDTADSPQIITLAAHLMDDKSGLNNGTKMMPSHARFVSPYSIQTKQVNFTPPPEQGDALDGVYISKMELPESPVIGTWKLDYLLLVDNAANSKELKADEVAGKKFPTDFVVTGHPTRGQLGFILIGPLLIAVIIYLFFYRVYLKLRVEKEGVWKVPAITEIYKGHDGVSSTSKAQFAFWTAAVLYSYLAITLAKIVMYHQGQFETSLLFNDIPENLFLVMGLSVTTTLAAKGITVSYVESGKLNKPEQEGKKVSGGLFLDDKGKPDLIKIQIMSWTFIAIGIYLYGVFHSIYISSGAPQLPDIDPALLVLMGIGDGAYVGKKIVTTGDSSKPKLDKITPDKAGANDEVTITGEFFGETKGQITIDGEPIDKDCITPWKNTEIKFKVPEGTTTGDKKVGVIVGDQKSNELTLKVE